MSRQPASVSKRSRLSAAWTNLNAEIGNGARSTFGIENPRTSSPLCLSGRSYPAQLLSM